MGRSSVEFLCPRPGGETIAAGFQKSEGAKGMRLGGVPIFNFLGAWDLQ